MDKLVKILRTLCSKFSAPSPKETLSDILSIPENREILLGVQRNTPPSPEKILQDVDKMIRYSVSTDYAIFAKEIWAEAIDCIDKLTKPNLTDREIDFYRGSLNQTLKILRMSYKARNMKEDSLKAAGDLNGSVRR